MFPCNARKRRCRCSCNPPFALFCSALAHSGGRGDVGAHHRLFIPFLSFVLGFLFSYSRTGSARTLGFLQSKVRGHGKQEGRIFTLQPPVLRPLNISPILIPRVQSGYSQITFAYLPIQYFLTLSDTTEPPQRESGGSAEDPGSAWLRRKIPYLYACRTWSVSHIRYMTTRM